MLTVASLLVAGTLLAGVATPAHADQIEVRCGTSASNFFGDITGTADIVAAVDFARRSQPPASVRGGGHNIVQNSLRNGMEALIDACDAQPVA